MAKYRISGVPIVDENRKLVGIITNRDMRFLKDYSGKIGDAMTKNNLVTAPIGTDLESAKEILMYHRIEKLSNARAGHSSDTGEWDMREHAREVRIQAPVCVL
jgi:predicted transcriptional regulator